MPIDDIRDSERKTYGYAPAWPFRVSLDPDGQGVTSEMGPVIEFIWTYFIWPIWDGTVRLEKK